MKTKQGKTALDIALQFGQEEIYKMLVAWEHIQSHLLKLDFHTVWHKFLKDYEAVINDQKSAEEVLSDIQMSSNIRMMERNSNNHSNNDNDHMIKLDDDYIRLAYEAAKNDPIVIKPWDGMKWQAFVKKNKLNGIIDLKTELELQQKGEMFKPINNIFKSINSKINEKTIEDREIPMPKPRLLSQISFQEIIPLNINAEKGLKLLSVLPEVVKVKQNSILNSSIRNHRQFKEIAKEVTNKISIYDDTNTTNKNEVDDNGDDDNNNTNNNKNKSISSINPLLKHTALYERRLSLANKVRCDAKFLKFSKKLTFSSAMHISLRTPHAPKDGTEEESSLLRSLASQGPDFDQYAKYKPDDKLSKYRKIEPVTNTIGMYSEEIAKYNPTERDALYSMLVNRTTATSNMSLDKKESTTTTCSNDNDASDSKLKVPDSSTALLDIIRKEKIDLVDNRRPRYVAKDLLPSLRVSSVVEQLSKADQAKKEQEQQSKQGLGTSSAINAARNALEEAMLDSTSNNNNNNDLTTSMIGNHKHIQKKTIEKDLATRKLFLKKEVVMYGKGRITSTHNTIGKLEDPWSTVKGRYTTLPGDRTI